MPRRVEPKSELVFRAAKARARSYLLGDGNGLALRVQPNGTKTWLFRYRRPSTGKENFLSLGPYPDITLVDTRRSAATARNLVREGIDPVEHRRAASTARKRAAEGAFHLVAKRWLDFKRKEWAEGTYRKAEFVVREYLTPALRNKPVSTLGTPEVKPVVEAIAFHAPNLATKARQYVGGIVTYAVQNGLREDGAVLTLRGVVPRHKKGHIPAITKPADIAPLVLAIDAHKSPVTRAALKLTMLTRLRPGVVAVVSWVEVNLKTAEWHVAIERMKMRHDHIVPLPKQAIAVLNELQSLTGKGHYVFPSPARQKTPHLHRDALSKALRETGFQGKHATHGFRGMLRTVGRERLGMDIDLEKVVARGGTAPQAVVPGYSAGGKTGTAYTATRHGYDRSEYRASFVGIVPIRNPRLIIAVSMDRPRGARHYGGDVSGPVFSRIASDAMRVLNIPPDE